MKAIIKCYKYFERTFGSMKFAVTIISIFAIALIYGTFMESYHGAEFANRLVYKSIWFMLIQLMMFISIVVATYVRLPARKPLYGFYTIHMGLITLFIGSFVTYISGIDGSLELMPNTPSRKIVIDEDFLKVSLMKENKSVRFSLPFNAFTTDMDVNYKDKVKLLQYIPSAKLETYWEKSKADDLAHDHGSSYMIFNDNVSQDFTLSINPSSDFKSTQTLGLLNIHYMPSNLFDCFTKKTKTGYLIWNTAKNTCFTSEEKNIKISKTDKGSSYLSFDNNGEMLKFFPDFSPLPVNDDLSKKIDSPFRIFSRKLFEKKPHLFLFGTKVAFYKKRSSSWVGYSFDDKPLIKLPWMQFNLRLITHKDRMTPFQKPVFMRPIQDKGKIIQGDIKAVKIALYGKEYWVRSDAPLALANGDQEVRFQFVKKEFPLPYQITLKKFKMDTNPGTKTPASYESFVDLLDGRNQEPATEHHVFMNNPLKYDDLTFYQASYYPVGPDIYASVFSVNFDPGRPVKYAGSILLVFGSMWHYYIRRKKKKNTKTKTTEVKNA
jgi:hypothetical protein